MLTDEEKQNGRAMLLNQLGSLIMCCEIEDNEKRRRFIKQWIQDHKKTWSLLKSLLCYMINIDDNLFE